MKFLKSDILFQEVPNEISLGFYIVGCSKRCKGCHSTELWDSSDAGAELTELHFLQQLAKYQSYVSCVIFLGGEWEPATLCKYLDLAQAKGLKTALYSGETKLPEHITSKLTYLKLGPWIAELGGLNSPSTNQEYWNLKTNQKLNHLFHN